MTVLADPITRQALRTLRKDLGEAEITPNEARYLVDTYYLWQDQRKRAANQLRAMGDAEPCRVIAWLTDEAEAVEAELRRVLHGYSQRSIVGRWAESIHGIGPVISAGLLAHIDMAKAPTVGHIYAFGGWDPNRRTWARGEKRPWNAALKTLFWKIGDSFVKSSGSDKSVYGPIYRQAKERIAAANDRGEYAAAAAETLESRPTHKQTAIYQQGKLPDGRVDLRARRIAVKIFLNHWHQVAYWDTFGKPAPAPYPIAHLGHAHEVPIPNCPF